MIGECAAASGGLLFKVVSTVQKLNVSAEQNELGRLFSFTRYAKLYLRLGVERLIWRSWVYAAQAASGKGVLACHAGARCEADSSPDSSVRSTRMPDGSRPSL